MLRRVVVVLSVAAFPASASAAPLGLPELPIPRNNSMTPARIALGDKLFHDDPGAFKTPTLRNVAATAGPD